MLYSASLHSALGPQHGFVEPRLTYVYSAGGVRYEGSLISNADLPV